MNLVAGAILLSVVLLSMALLCCAHAADNQMGKVQRKVATVRSDRSLSTKTDMKLSKQVSRVDRPEETAKFAPVVVEKQERAMESPIDPPELPIQLKGVRG